MEKKYVLQSGIRRLAIEVKCKVCNSTFLTRKKPKLTQFCSRECYYKRPKLQAQATCAFCGNVFSRTRSLLKKSKSGLRFCNKLCKCNAQRIGGTNEIMPFHYKNGKTTYRNIIKKDSKCVDCGECKLYCLVVHHVDGDRENNKENNLEIVCANCHIKRHLKLKGGTWVFCTKSLTPRNMLNFL